MTTTPQHESTPPADLPTDAPTRCPHQHDTSYGPVAAAPATSARTGWTPASAAVVAAAATFAITLAGFGTLTHAYRAGLADSGHGTGIVRVEGGSSFSPRGERSVPRQGGDPSSVSPADPDVGSSGQSDEQGSLGGGTSAGRGNASSDRDGRTPVDPQGGPSSKGDLRQHGETSQSPGSASRQTPAERPGQ